MPECNICGKEFPDSEGQSLSPRDFSKLEPRVADTKAVTLHSMASSIIMFNNPLGAADTPMWWVCTDCMSRCFSVGRTKGSVQMEQDIFGLVTGARRRRWWQFWK